MFLRVELAANLLDQLQLGFEEVNMLLLVCRELLEQVPRHAVVHGLAVLRGVELERPGLVLRYQVTVDDLLYALADPKGIDRLHVGVAL